jgi:hypothetical protein
MYDMLYKASWRFRFRHWYRQFKSRPGLTVAKLATISLQKIFSIGKAEPQKLPAPFGKIEDRIAATEKEGEILFWQQFADPNRI